MNRNLKTRPLAPRNQRTKDQEQQQIIKQLSRAGINVKEGKKTPRDGKYSGVVGDFGNKIKVNI
ncbi:hypothetical protein [Virgibacillus halodenitrificans]|uniref:hypothetical protein n=1 Tax=Virgibacillus halodenitrificans TaxID=1482 RepID=UPI000EF4BF55|nr:hypothetical protein [Virgibacillus halodenitrificans]